MPSRIFAPGLLQGHVVVVTGGGSGLGRASAQELTACGATVVVAGRQAEPLEETARLCEGTCETIVCDIREEDQVAGLPGMAHSSAARAGVENLMRVLSIEWARFNIRTTAVA